MYYEISQCQNTGNWWIWRCHEDGYREIVRTLSADLTIRQANAYMEALVADINSGL